jgi:hypothetical protein
MASAVRRSPRKRSACRIERPSTSGSGGMIEVLAARGEAFRIEILAHRCCEPASVTTASSLSPLAPGRSRLGVSYRCRARARSRDTDLISKGIARSPACVPSSGPWQARSVRSPAVPHVPRPTRPGYRTRLGSLPGDIVPGGGVAWQNGPGFAAVGMLGASAPRRRQPGATLLRCWAEGIHPYAQVSLQPGD